MKTKKLEKGEERGSMMREVATEMGWASNESPEGKGLTYFRCLHGAHERGIRFLLRTTRCCVSGERGDGAPALDEVVEGGVGVIFPATSKQG